MKAVLGLKLDPWHDTGASMVLDDGSKLRVVAISQERLDRVKNSRAFPAEAILYCLETAGCRLEDIDLVVADYICSPSLEDRFAPGPNGGPSPKREFFQRLEERGIPVVFAEHHLCHAASAYYATEWDEATAVVIDGHGSNYETQTLYNCRGNGITKVATSRQPGIGWMYCAVTECLLGFQHLQDGKTMGLAGWAKDGGPWTQFFRGHTPPGSTFDIVYPQFAEGAERWKLTAPDGLARRQPKDDPVRAPFAEYAYAAQSALESGVMQLIRAAARTLPSKRLCYSGGVALNIPANRLILDSGLYDDVFIQPAASDSGIPLGAALFGYYSVLGGEKRWRMEHAFLGRDYSAREMDAAVNAWKGPREDYDVEHVARILTNDYLLAWSQGASEYGPRALGHRSILCLPRHPGMKAYLNHEVKHREMFRPFAPLVPLESQSEYFDLGVPSPFMLINAGVNPGKATLMPAVVHADGTARVQSIRQREHPELHALLHRIGGLTGVPVLLNTSLNLAGEPIVETPAQAVDLFSRSRLDALVIGGTLLTKVPLQQLLEHRNPHLLQSPPPPVDSIDRPAPAPPILAWSPAELDVATDEFLTVCGTGRTLVAMPGAGAIVSRLLARGVEAWGLDPSPANGHDPATGRCVSGGLDLLPFDRAPFESAYLAGVLDDLPPGELRALAARLRESGVKSLVIRVGRRVTQPPESRDRVWWERIFLGAGFRKHPLRFRVLPYERLAHRDGEILLHFERVTPTGAVRDRTLVDDGLANDPSRQAGALSDALLVRYELAVPFVRPGSTVLDLGCETGAGLHLLQRATRAARFIGAHPEPASIDYARAHFGTHTTDFRSAAPADLLEELPEASVDFVILAQDLEEADAVDGLLNGAARILAPGGRLMFVFRSGTLCLPRQLEDALRGRFLLETSYHQAGGGGPADFISVTRSDLNRLTFDSADTWVVVAMKDPVCHPVPEYRETVFGHVAPSGHASLRYPEFYRNPWILHSLLHAGYRATSPTILVDSAVRLLREMPAESADLGAALCLLIYRTIEGAAPTDPPLSELLERSRAYLSIPVPNVHQLRWQVSISYALGWFHLRQGDFPLAREGFERCAAMDSLAFSTHLATKTTDALFWSGWLAYTSGDGDAAGAAWKRGLEFGERLLRQPLNDTLMNPACPNLFDYGDGMRELVYALENVAKCANGIHCLALEAQGISTRWDLIHNSFRFQHGTVTDALRHAQRQVERLCEDVAQARAQHEATRRELRERTAELNQARQQLQEAKAPPATRASHQQMQQVVAQLARLQKATPPPAARRR